MVSRQRIDQLALSWIVSTDQNANGSWSAYAKNRVSGNIAICIPAKSTHDKALRDIPAVWNALDAMFPESDPEHWAPIPTPAPVEDWTGLPERWKGRIHQVPMGPYYPSARFASHGRDFYIDGVPVPTHEDAIAAISSVINAARCLEGLPVISLPAWLPDGYSFAVNAKKEVDLLKAGGYAGPYPLTDIPMHRECLHLYAWHLALSPATAAPARELTEKDLPEGYRVAESPMFPGKFRFYDSYGQESNYYPTRSAAIRAAIDHAKAWREADRG
jgi:hypothetical protein